MRSFFFQVIPFFLFYYASAQLSSIEMIGSSSAINNPAYALNGTRDIGLRFNQKIGWYFSGNITAGLNITHINILPKVFGDRLDIRNTYNFIQLGGNFNLLSSFRTIRQGGRSAVGKISISCAPFKWYLCAGAELLQLKESSDQQSLKKSTNIYEGMGIEVTRLGKNAFRKYGAIVPFFEFRFFHNISGGYYASTDGFISFNKITISAGFKYTFGLPESN